MPKLNLFDKATDPKQYNLEALYWEELGAANSPTRQFFKDFLFVSPDKFNGKNVLDIGSGTGWLLKEMKKAGAKSVIGIEPSKKNVILAKKNYPDIKTILSSLEEYMPTKTYDVITSVMVMVHLPNVEVAMKKIASLLKQDGEFYTITPSYEYAKIPRFNYRIRLEHLSENEYAIAIKRPNGIIVDVIRKPLVYIKAAKKAGLSLVKKAGMKPSEDLIKIKPGYAKFKDVAIADFLFFKKLGE